MTFASNGITPLSLAAPVQNIASFKSTGLDFALSYRLGLGSGKLGAGIGQFFLLRGQRGTGSGGGGLGGGRVKKNPLRALRQQGA